MSCFPLNPSGPAGVPRDTRACAAWPCAGHAACSFFSIMAGAVRPCRVALRAFRCAIGKAMRSEATAGIPARAYRPASPVQLRNHQDLIYFDLSRASHASPAFPRAGVRGRLAFRPAVSRPPATADAAFGLAIFFFSYDCGPAPRRAAYIAWQTRNMRSSTSWSASAMISIASFLSSVRLSSAFLQPGNTRPSYLMP